MEEHYDHEFDRLFARDLKAAGQNSAPDPEEWSALSSRLDSRRKGWRWPLFLPWFLLAALALSNGWMFMQWRTVNHELAGLQQQPTTISPSTTLQPEHRATIVYDTVYRTVVVTHRVVEERLSLDEKKQSGNQSLSNNERLPNQIEKNAAGVEQKIWEIKPENKNAILSNGIENQNVTIKKIANESANDLTPALSHTSPDSFAQLSTDTTQHDLIPGDIAAKSADSLTRQPSAKTSFDSLLTNAPIIKRQRTPLRWRIGVGLGVASPLTNVDLGIASPLGISLTGEVLLGRHWAVVPGVTYVSHTYRMHHGFDPRLLVNAPVSPGPEYGFRYIEGNMAHLVTSLALRYRFQPDRAWSWYLSAGYAARFTASCQAEYEFDQHNTGESYHYEIRPTVPNRVQMGLTQVGLEYAVHPRWTLFFEATGLFDFGPGQRTFPTGIGQLGVKWGRK